MGLLLLIVVCLFVWRDIPQWAMASSFMRFLYHTQRRITVGRTPLDEWSARRRDLYLTTNNTHNIQTPMSPVGFEPTILVGERPQTCTLDSVVTELGTLADYLANLPAHEGPFGCFANINCILYRNYANAKLSVIETNTTVVYCDVTPCSLVDTNIRFRVTCSLCNHIHDCTTSSCSPVLPC